MGKTYRRNRTEWDDPNRVKKSDMKRQQKQVVREPIPENVFWLPNDKTAEDEADYREKHSA